jgi:acyl-CoA synthetase (NDP forming)
MRPVLMPASVAVIGASRRVGSVGRVILRNIISAGFSGPVYPVNPYASELDRIACVPSVAALPDQVDLAVIAVPAGAVLGIADDCGRRGVKALVVIAAGLSGPARAELLGSAAATACGWSGRPASAWPTPGIGLDATFAARHATAGTVGLALQSTGGTGFTLLEHLSRLGVGISSLVSFGDKDDVSGTDMLQWWECDKETKLALLYLESIGNPPKFARTARRVGRTTPILTVAVGRSATGRRLAGARAAKTATPLITRQALFQQAGIIATANLGELLDTAALLASQPVPAGNRVGVVSNTRGAAVLAADACADAGLQIASLAGNTQQALRDILGPDALVAGPVDTTVLVTPGRFRECLELVGGRPGRRRGPGADHHDRGQRPWFPRWAQPGCRCRSPRPCWTRSKWSGCCQAPAGTPLRSPPMPTPSPPPAPSAMPRATAPGGRPRQGRVPDLEGLRQDRARDLVAGLLADRPGAAGWRWTRPWSCLAATACR